MIASRVASCHRALIAVINTSVCAAAGAAEPLTVDPLGGWQIAKVSAGLLVVVAAIVATAAGLKRLKSLHAAHGSHMKIIDGISVSTRDRIVLLEVDEQRLLVGISPGRIERLHVFERPQVPAFDELVRQAGAEPAEVSR
ncbi:MAG: flagellar biosynthetic protein FliO [Gammaproteobacteria bacterium]|jgi:flagellar protein FliO/FliZ